MLRDVEVELSLHLYRLTCRSLQMTMFFVFMRTLLYGGVISVSTTNISICINNDTLQHIETFVYHSGDEDEDDGAGDDDGGCGDNDDVDNNAVLMMVIVMLICL